MHFKTLPSLDAPSAYCCFQTWRKHQVTSILWQLTWPAGTKKTVTSASVGYPFISSFTFLGLCFLFYCIFNFHVSTCSWSFLPTCVSSSPFPLVFNLLFPFFLCRFIAPCVSFQCAIVLSLIVSFWSCCVYGYLWPIAVFRTLPAGKPCFELWVTECNKWFGSV